MKKPIFDDVEKGDSEGSDADIEEIDTDASEEDSFYSCTDVPVSVSDEALAKEDMSKIQDVKSENLVASVLNWAGINDVVEAVEEGIATAVESSSDNEAMVKLSIEQRQKLVEDAEGLKEPHPVEHSFCSTSDSLQTWLPSLETIENMKKKTLATTASIWDWTGMKSVVDGIGETMSAVESSLDIPKPEVVAKESFTRQRRPIKVDKKKNNGDDVLPGDMNNESESVMSLLDKFS